MTCLYPSPLFSFHSSRSHPFLYLSLYSYLLSPLLSSLSFSSLSPLLSSLHCSFPSFHSYLPYVPLPFSLTSLLSSLSSIPPLLSSLPFIISSLSTLDNISKENDNTLWHWHSIRPRKSPLQIRGMTIWIFISIVRYLIFFSNDTLSREYSPYRSLPGNIQTTLQVLFFSLFLES